MCTNGSAQAYQKKKTTASSLSHLSGASGLYFLPPAFRYVACSLGIFSSSLFLILGGVFSKTGHILHNLESQDPWISIAAPVSSGVSSMQGQGLWAHCSEHVRMSFSHLQDGRKCPWKHM
jgi:hypothetical protein